MKNKNFLFALATLSVALGACVRVEDTFNRGIPTNRKGEYAILFSGAQTKAQVSSTAGTGYDQFSLFAWNSIKDTLMNPYLVEANGANSYQYDEVNGQELKYFKRVANWHDFIGIIPTTHNMKLSDGKVSVDGVVAFSVDDKRAEKAVNTPDTLFWSAGLAVDSPEEFLWAYKRVEKADYGNIVDLPFNHENALLFLGFSSDKSDTKIIDYVPGVPAIPATPEVRDTTDTWFNLKNGSNAVATATQTKAPGSTSYVAAYALPDALVSEIKSYYSVDGSAAGDYQLKLAKSAWDPINNTTSTIKKLRVVKEIPAAYKMTVDMHGEGIMMDFFDAIKYLRDNGYEVQSAVSGGKPQVFSNNYVILDAYVNGAAYTITALNWGDSYSVPQYTIDITPGEPEVPAVPAIEGVRVFSADSLGLNNLPADSLYCTHVAHTMRADALISADGCALNNRTVSNEVIQFSLPETTTLSGTALWSPSTFYALPGDENFNFIVVKLSYIYNGITTYDVRVPIHLPEGGLKAGKYYKYELYLTSTGNGTNDPVEAAKEKDEIIIEDNPVISVKLIDCGYAMGDARTITI